MTIQEVCWARRDKLRMTAQMIADQSGVSFSTVNNFFSSASKNPAAETTGNICRALGVSLDEFFHIKPPEKELSDCERTLIERDLEHEKEKVRMLNAYVTQKNRVISALLALCAILCGMLIMCLIVDFNYTTGGLIQNGSPSAIAWLAIASSVCALLLIIGIILRLFTGKKGTT